MSGCLITFMLLFLCSGVTVATLFISGVIQTGNSYVYEETIPIGLQAHRAYVVTGKPTLNAGFINNVLCSASSPACQTGATLHKLGIKYGIDPAYALAFFRHESSYGLNGIARDTKSLGNIRCSYGYICKDGYRAYKSWEEGYEDWYRLIATQYVQEWKLRTVQQIIPVYAPTNENDTTEYIRVVESSVTVWRDQA